MEHKGTVCVTLSLKGKKYGGIINSQRKDNNRSNIYKEE